MCSGSPTPEPLSKTVIVPSECGSASCWDWVVTGLGLGDGRPLAADAAGHHAGRPVHGEQHVGVAQGEHELALAEGLQRVDVHEVPGDVGGGQRVIRVADRQVVQGMPLEHDAPGRDVDLLHDAVDHRGVLLTARQRAGVGADGGVGIDQRRVLRGDRELVRVPDQAVAGGEVLDDLVRRVGDVVAAAAVARAVGLAFPPRQDRLALVLLDPQVGRIVGGRHVVDEAAGRVVDLVAVKALDAVRGQEEVAGGEAVVRHERFGGRVQRRCRDVTLDVGRDRGGRQRDEAAPGRRWPP